MLYHVNLDGLEGKWWEAYVAELPGCITTGTERESTLSAVPDVIVRHVAWLSAHGFAPDKSPIEVELVESHRAWHSSPTYEVGAFFALDRLPLSKDELETFRMLFESSREDLMDEVSAIAGHLDTPIEDGWSILTILEHLTRAESFYLRKLGLPAKPRAKETAVEEMADARRELLSVLANLANDESLSVVEFEVWSPRKVLRRALCHERDHFYHLRRFKEALLSSS